MIISFSLAQRDQLVAEAAGAHPLECCGLIVGHELTVQSLLPSDNLASGDQSRRFEIDPTLYLKTQRQLREAGEGQRIIGLYHSHPNGNLNPSPQDRAGAAEKDLVWLIIAGDEIAAYWFDGEAFHKIDIDYD